MSDASYQQPDLTLVGPEHVSRYLETDGEVGSIWNGAPIILLTTTGRKSGLPRTNALIHGRDGDDYLVVASMGGAPMHPNWYQNLVRHPAADVQDRADRFGVIARTADDDEKPRLWRIMTEVWPNYDAYQARTERVIPVVVLTPTASA